MNYAIVLAGGKGTRMNSEIPKQFLVVGGKPLISYSLDVFEKSPFIDAIIIVTSQDYTGYMKALVKENGYKKLAIHYDYEGIQYSLGRQRTLRLCTFRT